MATENRRMAQLRDTRANFDAAGLTPLAGEVCIETDSGQIKIGDGVTTWENLPYLGTQIRDIESVGSSSFDASPAYCGKIVSLTGAGAKTINLTTADQSRAGEPAGATGHFPRGGTFYVTTPSGGSSTLTFNVNVSGFSLDYNEYGAVGNTTTTRQVNNGNAITQKLYSVTYAGAGLWLVFELDTDDVWDEARIKGDVAISYGGFYGAGSAVRGVSKTLASATTHVIELNTPTFGGGSGIGEKITFDTSAPLTYLETTTTPALSGQLEYEVRGGIVVKQAMVDVLIGARVNAGSIDIRASRWYEGTTSSTQPTVLEFYGWLDLAAGDQVDMEVDLSNDGAAPYALTYYDAWLYLKRISLTDST